MTETLERALSKALGIDHPALAATVRLDPDLAEAFLGMAEAVRRDSSLSAKEQALINLAINASVPHMNAEMTRAYLRAALREGATKGEILEVLQLTSVLGVHGTMPGVEILTQAEGGLEAIEANSSPERLERGRQARAVFEARRGPMTPAWQACAVQIPAFVEAYASFSGVPWACSHLDARMKELVYIAIDLVPQHVHMEGARVHIARAREKGASEQDVRSVIQMMALLGIQTQCLALPMLAEELAAADT